MSKKIFSPIIICLALSFLSACASNSVVLDTSPDVAVLDNATDPIAQEIIKKALNDNTAYVITSSLTQEVGPRLAGSEGDKAAIRWGINKLAELGFKNIHTQAIEVPKWERGETRVQLVSPYSQNLIATALGGSVGTHTNGIKAEVLLTDTVKTLELLDDSEVKGKIVFFNRRMQASKDGSGYSIAGKERWSGAQAAVKKGAVAIIIRPAGTSHHRFAHTGSMGTYDENFTKIPAASLTNSDADILEYAYQNRNGKPVVIKLNMSARHLGTSMSANVIGELPGTEKPEEIILLGAHLDSWDLGTGAIDDASGIGIITAAVKILKDAGIRPKRTLRVVYFGNEEFGLSGAREYARLNTDKVNTHIVGVESDFGAGKIWRFASMLPKGMLPLKQKILANIKSLGVEEGNNESGGGADLGPMRKLGMPTYAFTQDGTKYFHYHHTADDTLDKVDPEDLKQNVAVYAVAIYLTAMSDLDFVNINRSN